MRGSMWTILSLALGLAACNRGQAPAAADVPAPPGLPPTAAQVAEHWWVCGDVAVSTQMRGELLTLSGPFGERELMPTPCSPGDCYTDDKGNEFWNEGQQATLKLDGKDVGECTADKADAASS